MSIYINWEVAQRFNDKDRQLLKSINKDWNLDAKIRFASETIVGAVVFDMVLDEKVSFSKQFKKRKEEFYEKRK